MEDDELEEGIAIGSVVVADEPDPSQNRFGTTYSAEVSVVKVEGAYPVRLTSIWTDGDEDMRGSEGPIDGFYLTKNAAKKLAQLLRKASES